MFYGIVLLALNANFFIQEAQRQFATYSEGYLLSNTSLPHITLAHFRADNHEAAYNIWENINKKATDIPEIRLLGIGLNKRNHNLWAASLIVERHSKLVNLHKLVINELNENNMSYRTPSGDLYRPHLTLARIKAPIINSFNEAILENTQFVLAFGIIDDNGQLIEVLNQKS